jgi:hypothetical protein
MEKIGQSQQQEETNFGVLCVLKVKPFLSTYFYVFPESRQQAYNGLPYVSTVD